MQDIVLVRPDLGDFIFRQVNPPIGLGYLAAHLMRAGYKVHVLDMANRRVTLETLGAYIEKKRPVLVGISALSVYYERMKVYSRYLKERLPDIPIVLGGVHASSLPVLSLKECRADYVVVGEGETTLLELADKLASGSKNVDGIEGVGYLDANGEYRYAGDRPLIEDLKTVPWPAWHLINPNSYPKDPHGTLVKYIEVAPVMSTRGCPFSCHYCSSCQFWRQKIRFRDPVDVVDEIQFLKEKFGIREIHFWDDNLTLKRDHVVGICKEILRRGLRMAFCAPNGVRVDTLDEKTLRLMKAAGFYKLTFAVESGSHVTLRSVGKKTSLKKIVENTVIAKKLGYILNSYFIIGFPGEDERSIELTKRFSRSVPLDFTTFFLMKPLPGSKIFEDWMAGKDLEGFDWDTLNFYCNQHLVSPLPPDYLERQKIKAFNDVFYRARVFMNRLLIKLRYLHWSQIKVELSKAVHLLFGFHFTTRFD